MDHWRSKPTELAIRLISVLGFDLKEASDVLKRHFVGDFSPEEIQRKLQTDHPSVLTKASDAQEKRKSTTYLGVAAPAPWRRFSSMPDDFLAFVQNQPAHGSIESICWKARQAGFDANLTDVRVAGDRVEYEFRPFVYLGASWMDAITDDLCTWPVDDPTADVCGNKRDAESYCGAHYCRSIGLKSIAIPSTMKPPKPRISPKPHTKLIGKS